MQPEDQIQIATEYVSFYEKLQYKARLELLVATRLGDTKMAEAAETQIAIYDEAITVINDELQTLGA